MLLSVYANVSFAQLSQADKNYMLDLSYIENQAFQNKAIEDNIKRQPVLADYFAISIKQNEVVLVPYANQSLPEVRKVVDTFKSKLQYNDVKYEDFVKQGQKTVKVHLVYKQKPEWVTSTIFD